MGKAGADRRERIMTSLLERKMISVNELATSLEVSEATVRRDLRKLAGESQVNLVHGGAALPPLVDHSFIAKSRRAPDAKKAIGQIAADLVEDGDHLFIDSGTTCIQMAPGLRMRQSISAFVTSVRLANELCTPGLTVVLLGGQYRPARMDTVGPLALHSLEQFRSYKAFMSADGLDRGFGPAASDMETAHLHQLVIRNASETYLLADSTKFENPALYKIASWDQINRIVTEKSPGSKWEEFLGECGIELIYPGKK